MAAVLVCHMAIAVLFGSVAGTAADRIDRRKLMLLSDLFRGSIACMLAFCLYYLDTSFAVMLVLVALSAFAGLFQGPSFHATITRLAGKARIGQATSATYLMDNVARISGLALAGVMVSSLGGFWAMAFNAGTFFFSALCVMAAGPFPRMETPPRKEKKSFMKELAFGFSYMRSDALTRSVILLNPVLILLFMSSLMLIQVLAIKDWKAGPVAFGLIEMCVPLGYLIGAGLIMAFGSRLGRRGWWVFTGVIALGPVFTVIANMNRALAALPLILLGGMLFAFSSMMIQIILRSEIRDDIQGRVYGTLGAITGIAPSIGLIVTSSLADLLGTRTVLGAQGLCLIAVGVAAAVWLKPLRNYK